MELMALGRFFSGFLASAAVVPTSSMPTKANTAIWKPATKPMNSLGKKPPWLHRLVKLACPASLWKPLKIMNMPTMIRAAMAMILMRANQNSVSPNALTVVRFSSSRMATVARPGIQSGSPGQSSREYPAMAMTSAIPVITQQNQ